MSKVAILGGGGVRTPLLAYGLGQSQALLRTSSIALFDVDRERVETIARLCREILRSVPNAPPVEVSTDIEAALTGAKFILNSIRVGGIGARARDERIAIQHGLAGQETTGPGGAAMALRTIPVALAYARLVEKYAPTAWFINFTNPAGIVTQALTRHTAVKAVGICDTPAELFHNIASALRESSADMKFDYSGLNHLGWVRRVFLRGRDITERLLADPNLLRKFYSAELFDPALIQALQLIPTEYLFFYYSGRRALSNQLKAGATRGEELERLNSELFSQLSTGDSPSALRTYRAYLISRNRSYMQLEAQAGSAFTASDEEMDPFDTATGYHRIAVDVMTGLVSETPHQVVVNVRNNGSIPSLEPEDIIEVPCQISRTGIQPSTVGELPEAVRGLVVSVKAYERTIIGAAVSRSLSLASLALLEYPIIGQWELARHLLEALRDADPHLSYLAQQQS